MVFLHIFLTVFMIINDHRLVAYEALFLNQHFSKIYERKDLHLIIGLIPELILFEFGMAL